MKGTQNCLRTRDLLEVISPISVGPLTSVTLPPSIPIGRKSSDICFVSVQAHVKEMDGERKLFGSERD